MANRNQVSTAARDRRRDVGGELLKAVRDIKSGKTGRIFRVEVTQVIDAGFQPGLRMSQPKPKQPAKSKDSQRKWYV